MSTVLSSERTGRITASRAAAILGQGRNGHSRESVLREMVREHFWEPQEFEGNFITEYGREHEPDAVVEYELTRGVQLLATGAEQQTVVHPGLRLAATPDGLHKGSPVFVEIKCPWKARYTSLAERPDYKIQMKFTRAVLEAATDERWDGRFAIWRTSGLLVDELEREDDWLESVWPVFEAFLDEYDAIIADDERARPFREPLVDLRTDAAWLAAEAVLLELDDDLTEIADERQAAYDELVRLAGKKTAKGPQLMLVRTKGRAGSVSYKKALDKFAPEVTESDLEQFRGDPGAPGWQLRHTHAKEK